jgi:hypothetical protein
MAVTSEKIKKSQNLGLPNIKLQNSLANHTVGTAIPTTGAVLSSSRKPHKHMKPLK